MAGRPHTGSNGGRVNPALSSVSKTKKVKKSKSKSKSADELAKLCPVKFNEGMQDKELLKNLEKLITNMLPVAYGSYMNSPKSGNAYAFGSLIEKIQAIIDQQNDTVDYDLLVMDLTKAFTEIQERVLLDLGTIIKKQKSICKSSVKSKASRKTISQGFDDLYTEYATIVKSSMHDMEDKIKRVLLESRSKKRK